jgi:hypothetical protein
MEMFSQQHVRDNDTGLKRPVRPYSDEVATDLEIHIEIAELNPAIKIIRDTLDENGYEVSTKQVTQALIDWLVSHVQSDIENAENIVLDTYPDNSIFKAFLTKWEALKNN